MIEPDPTAVEDLAERLFARSYEVPFSEVRESARLELIERQRTPPPDDRSGRVWDPEVRAQRPGARRA